MPGVRGKKRSGCGCGFDEVDNFELEVLRASSSDALRMTAVEKIAIRRRIRFTAAIAKGEKICLEWRMIIFWTEVVAASPFQIWRGYREFRL